jgi:hypothetical protein
LQTNKTSNGIKALIDLKGKLSSLGSLQSAGITEQVKELLCREDDPIGEWLTHNKNNIDQSKLDSL